MACEVSVGTQQLPFVFPCVGTTMWLGGAYVSTL